MKSLFVLLLILSAQSSGAATFVGNGGSAVDVELQLTLNQVHNTLEQIKPATSADDQKLCVCSESFQGHAFCDLLQRLNAEQQLFCSKLLREKAPAILEILNAQQGLNVVWSREPIEVQEKSSLRAVDAVTDPKEKTITVYQSRFLSMNDSEKVFLMTHELFHLTSYKDQLMSDQASVGPFQGEEGGRQLINAMAAAVVMKADQGEVFENTSSASHRSKAYKKNWFNLSVMGASRPTTGESDFAVGSADGGEFSYRFQWSDHWGALVEVGTLEGTQSMLSTINGDETRSWVGAGLAYRWFPFSNPLSFSGQSHFLFTGKVVSMNGTYKLSDDTLSTTATSSNTGFVGGVDYYLPFKVGFWAVVGLEYSTLHPSYNIENQIDVTSKNDEAALKLGVSYAF